MRATRLTLVTLATVLAACGDGTGPGATVAIKFGTAGAPAPSASAPNLSVAPAYGAAAAQQLTVAGTNGTLSITDIRLIVDEFELDRVGGGNCDTDPAQCENFEAPPFFVDVPLTGAPLTVANRAIPAGRYERLEFEVNDLQLTPNEDGAQVQALSTAVRAAFPDWPDEASMVVVGTFTPAGGGSPRAFRAYFIAWIRVELAFEPAHLEITDASKSVVIAIHPDVWFKRADGSVLDLSQWDFPTTQQMLEFQLEIQRGFELLIER